MGFIDRARSKMPSAGDYLDKEELVRSQSPFAIVSVAYDEHGGNFGPRWSVKVEPWYEDQDEPEGLITLAANPYRNAVMEDLQAQLDENGEPLGPACVIRGKTAQGNRFFDIDEFDEGTGAGKSAALKPASPTEPARAGRQRPAGVAAAHQSTGQRERAAAPAEPEPEQRRRGRPRKDSQEGPAAATPVSEAQDARPTADMSKGIPTGAEAARAQEVKAGSTGRAICPECSEEVVGRIFPGPDGKPVLIHQHCKTTGKAEVLHDPEVVEA